MTEQAIIILLSPIFAELSGDMPKKFLIGKKVMNINSSLVRLTDTAIILKKYIYPYKDKYYLDPSKNNTFTTNDGCYFNESTESLLKESKKNDNIIVRPYTEDYRDFFSKNNLSVIIIAPCVLESKRWYNFFKEFDEDCKIEESTIKNMVQVYSINSNECFRYISIDEFNKMRTTHGKALTMESLLNDISVISIVQNTIDTEIKFRLRYGISSIAYSVKKDLSSISINDMTITELCGYLMKLMVYGIHDLKITSKSKIYLTES